MRRLTLIALLGASSCAGFRALDRGDWVLVWTDESVRTEIVNGTPIEVVKPAPGARREVISLERYESEITEGRRRKAGSTLGELPRLVTEVSEPLELMVGEVRELRIDEPQEAEVFVSGSAVKPYWTRKRDVAEWRDGQPADRKESGLFLLADEAGTSKVKVQLPGKEPTVIEVAVHEK
jgi:hypothetical protein